MPPSVRNSNSKPRLQQKTNIKEIILNNFMKKYFPQYLEAKGDPKLIEQ